MKKLKFIFCTIAMLSIASPLYSQTYYYDVLIRNKKSGKLIAHRSEERDKQTTFKITSEVETSMIFTITVSYILTNTYINGELEEAFIENLVNGRTESHSKVKRDKSGRYIVESEEGNNQFNQPVHYSIATMYFVEPINETQIFSEKYGVFCPLTQNSDGFYVIHLPNGNETRYRYEHGQCVEVQNDTRWAKVKFIRQQR
ncbi:MAG: hypothetical protein JJT94_11915 [Bernardetiaceae bacterium]|nr:hypothetical protein [Bernardetiaceae bacterium]